MTTKYLIQFIQHALKISTKQPTALTQYSLGIVNYIESLKRKEKWNQQKLYYATRWKNDLLRKQIKGDGSIQSFPIESWNSNTISRRTARGKRPESNVSRTKPQADDRRGRPARYFEIFQFTWLARARPIALARSRAISCPRLIADLPPDVRPVRDPENHGRHLPSFALSLCEMTRTRNAPR